MTERVNPFVGMMSTFEAMKDQVLGNEYWREGAMTEEFDGIIVDTIKTVFDTGKPETGIQVNGAPWVIVEQYESEEEAKAGHAKWAASMKANPKQELKDINLWGI